ncbi:MAG: UbiA family prenyltransferase, partial [candidate division Zixibacteria bacterium]|nr:UbiA family prenyltransferase [candidate division Zixibacteria bacterium]
MRLVKIIDFIFAARPMLLLPVWSIYLISFRQINYQEPFTSHSFLLLAGVSLMVAGAYFINQIFDYESDLINKKIGFLQKGLISRREMTAAFMTVSAISLIISLLAGWEALALYMLIFLLGYFYSAPPLRLKDRPFWGLIANGFGYGLLLPFLVIGFFKAPIDER